MDGRERGKINGFNCVSRRAIYGGLRRWFPELIPTFRKFYARRGSLYTIGPEGKRLAVDEEGVPYYSAEGCSQGDPLGPFFFAIGYHESLLATQAAHPDITILCYLDDTYYLGLPDEAHAALLTGELESTRRCDVRSNCGKQEVLGGAEADLSRLPPTLRGAPSAPPDPTKGYGGGRLLSTKVLGAFIGDKLECSRRLQKRVSEALANLDVVGRLRDTRQHNVSMQVQFEILRYCANTSLVYFLRTMGVEATASAAALHDRLIADAFHVIVGSGLAPPDVRNRAARQARLPVKMGGCGLTEQAAIAGAACVGSWALTWRPMQQLAPQLFGGVDLDTAPEPVFGELRRAHAGLMEAHARVSGVHNIWDATYFDYDKDGEGCTRYHPTGLAKHKELLPLNSFGTDDDYLQSAQRKYSSVIHHSCWLKLQIELQASSRREAVRFISVSQPHAGSFINAVPSQRQCRVPTWALGWCCSAASACRCSRRRRRSGGAAATGGSSTRSATWRRRTASRATRLATSSATAPSTTRCGASTVARRGASRTTTTATPTTGRTSRCSSRATSPPST